MSRDRERQLDVGLNMEGLVQHTFHIYDGLVARLGNLQDNNEEDASFSDTVQDKRFPEQAPEARQQSTGEAPQPEGKGAPEPVAVNEDMLDDDLHAMEHVPPTPDELLEESARTPLFAGS